MWQFSAIIWDFKVLEKKLSKNLGPRSEKLVFNSVLNFRRVTHFWLCLLETQVERYALNGGHNLIVYPSERPKLLLYALYRDLSRQLCILLRDL